MKSRLFIATLLLLLCLSTAVSAADDPADLDAAADSLSETVVSAMERYEIPGTAIALVEGGEAVWAEGFGWADPKSGAAAHAGTLFRAESITKSLTAWAVFSLIEDRRMELDDPAVQHLQSWQFPDTEFDESEVTIGQLLSHTSGLTGASDRRLPDQDRPPIEEVLAGQHGLEEARLVREPGSAFEYSNQGFVVLEVLVADVAGQDYESYVQERILRPLGIEEAHLSMDDDVRSEVAVSHDFEGEPLPVYEDPFSGAGGLLIPVPALARFFASYMPGSAGEPAGRGVLDENTLEAMLAPVTRPSGFQGIGSQMAAMGHFVESMEQNDGRYVFHIGEGSGSLAIALVAPEEEAGIVIMTNSKRSWPLLLETVGHWAELKDLDAPAMARIHKGVQWGLRIAAAFLLGTAGLLLARLVSWFRRGQAVAQPAGRRFFIHIGAAVLLLAGYRLGSLLAANLLPVLYGQLLLPVLFLAGSLILHGLFRPGIIVDGDDGEAEARCDAED